MHKNNKNKNNQKPQPNKPDPLRTPKILLKISLVIFVFAISLLIIVLAQECNCQSSNWCGVGFFLQFMIDILPVFTGFVLSCIATTMIHERRKHGAMLSTNFKIIRAITLLQVPILILLWIVGNLLLASLH